MRLLLIGGTDLTVAIASALHDKGLGPAACVGIGKEFSISYSETSVANMRAGDLHGWSRSHAVPYLESTDADVITHFAEQNGTDVCLVAGWYHFVPARLRERFRYGAWGLHGSLLPALRGGAPLNWAILSGVKHTGITLFKLDDGIDDGPILDQRVFAVEDTTTVGNLINSSTVAACEMITTSLPQFVDGLLQPRPQTGTPSYGLQRIPADGRIDWRLDAQAIHRLVRAVSEPYSGAFTDLREQIVRIWDLAVEKTPVIFGAPGQIARLPSFDLPIVLTGTVPVSIKRATFDDGKDAMPMLIKSSNQRLS